MKTKIFCLMILFVLVLTACQPAAPAVATQPSAPETAPTQVPATEEEAAPAATDVSEEAAPAGEADPIALAIDLANKATRGESAELQGSSGKTIGIVMPALDNDGWRAIYIGALSKAIELDVSVITLDARDQVETQTAMIEDLITKQVDAIAFVPVDSAAMSSAVQKANAAGIPVVTMDRSTEGGDVVALVESNNVEIGQKGADLMAEVAQEYGVDVADLKVLELLGDLATSAGQERHEGFSTTAAELGINVVAELPTNWSAEKANAAVLDGFQAHPDINAIYMASGCAMYSGVESAMRSLNKFFPGDDANHIILISTDGCPAPLQAMRDGYVDADSAQQLLATGTTAIQVAVDAIDGKMPESGVIRLGPDPIRPDNVDELTHWSNVLNVAQ
ncbi:MAG: sugar ABC transporter substrate-binding protein [Chloroflexi bacterium]|nr:sugar ABC transporter substrate-binding protein [Chloroflexota bacterium]